MGQQKVFTVTEMTNQILKNRCYFSYCALEKEANRKYP